VILGKVWIRSKKDLKLYCEEMGKMKRRLVINGIFFLFIAFFLTTVGLVSQNARANGAAGTWTGTCTDSTHVAVFYYDVVLELNGESSVSGTLQLTCTRIDASSGWSDQSMIGVPHTIDVYGTVSGSELTLQMNIYTLTLEISGDTMTGGGQGVDAANVPNTWSFDLRGGGGFGSLDVYSLAIPSASLSFIGGISGLFASSLPAPRGIMGFRGRTRNRAPRFNHPYVRQIPPQVAVPPPPPPPPPFGAPAPGPAPLSNPIQTLGMPLQQIGSTDGSHPVPWDAPRQCDHDRDPDDYPYPRGTSAAMRCPYCGCNTLSPFTTGWFCTNPLCPARREWLQKRCTHHEFNNMTWRVL
jgi:hypothetical protein